MLAYAFFCAEQCALVMWRNADRGVSHAAVGKVHIELSATRMCALSYFHGSA